MSDIAVIVPVLYRPDNVAPLVESYLASGAPGRLVFVTDLDDTSEIAAIRPHLEHDQIDIIVSAGNPRTFPRKANLGYRETDEPWMLLVGDDVTFEPGWWNEALAVAGEDYHLIATNDRVSPRVLAGNHATHPLIRRWWVDEHGASWDGPGTLCHEGYRHWFVDDEWTIVARQQQVFAFAPKAFIAHHHPSFGGAEEDETYRLGRSGSTLDRSLFEHRLRVFAPGAVIR